TLTVAPQVSGRPQVQAQTSAESLYEVSFYARAAGDRGWTLLGTDDNAPYRVFPDVSGYAPGTALQLLAVAKDNAGHLSFARGSSCGSGPCASAPAFSCAWATVLKPGIGIVRSLRAQIQASAPCTSVRPSDVSSCRIAARRSRNSRFGRPSGSNAVSHDTPD